MSALRVLEVGLDWPPETFIQLKLRCLAERGLDVRVGAHLPDGAAPADVPGLRLERLPTLGQGADRVERHLHNLRPDVLHFEWMTVASAYVPLLERWDGPVVVSCRGSELPAGDTANGRPARALVERVFKRADAVHLVHQAKRDEAARFGLARGKAEVIKTGVDTDVFRPGEAARPPGDELRIVSVGWLRWLKGYEYGLVALSELVREGVPATLEIVGGDPLDHMGEQSERARIVQSAGDLGLEDRVRLRGHIDTSEVVATLQRSDVLLHSSLSEGLPNVVVEAMACGLPVVATDVGGTREAVTDGVEGFVVPPRDPRAAAAALRTLWSEPDLRERMGRAGLRRVQSDFTLDRLADEWMELYERVARQAGSPAASNAPPLRLLGAGPLTWTQGYEYALSAVRLLADRGVACEYRIAGDGPHRDAVAFAIHQLRLDDRVEVVGLDAPGALDAQLGWADAVVDASVGDEAPEVVGVAIGAGLPVVTTHVLDEAAENVTGVAARDPAALSDALAALSRTALARG